MSLTEINPLTAQIWLPFAGSSVVIDRTCLKIMRVQMRQGKNGQKSGVYTVVHEHFEPVFNAVSASAAILR